MTQTENARLERPGDMRLETDSRFNWLFPSRVGWGRVAHLGVVVGVLSIIANIAGILAVAALFMIAFPEWYQFALARLTRAGWTGLSRILPFPVITFLVIFYLLPVSRALAGRAADIGRVRKRILNFPIVTAIFGLLGWLIAYAIQIVGVYQLDTADGARYLSVAFVQFFLVGSLVFVISYYTLEAINRRLYIPTLFAENNVTHTPGVIQLSVRRRFFIFAYAASVFPALVLIALLVRLNNSGDNALGRDVSCEIAITALCLFSLTGLLTYLVARAYEEPLRSMARATKRIRSGDFGTATIVRSADELGELGESLNDMARELAEKEYLKDTFGRVVDPAVRDYILSGDLKPGGEERDATVLFTDIRGFTGLSEERSPEEVVSLLNRYFDAMSRVVRSHGGLVNKFIGDAIMAIFGAPLALENHASAAVRAALEMRAVRDVLNEQLAAEGLPVLRTGIGIHTGRLMAGNIGSAERLEYTVIGDAVNLASRIEGLCKKLQRDILISEAVARSPGVPGAEPVGQVVVRGRKDEIGIYAL